MKVSFNSLRVQPLSFKAHPLKKDWLEGQMPSVIHGFYGDILDTKTVTLEHILPKSKGGKSCLSNYALASGPKNWARADKPLAEYFNPEAFKQYCEEMMQVHSKNIDGPSYVEQLIETVKNVLKQGL